MVHRPEQHHLHDQTKHDSAHHHVLEGHQRVLDEVHRLMKSEHHSRHTASHIDSIEHDKSVPKHHALRGDQIVFTPLYSEKHQTTAKPLAEKRQFDSTKSVEQQIKEGIFKQASDATPSHHNSLEASKTPKITVVYENKNPDAPTTRPNYIVKKDGSISVVRNPEGTPHDAEVVIQVARDAKQTGAPDKVQQRAIDELVAYQGDRIVEKFGADLKEIATPHGKLKQVEIKDAQNLVSDKIEQRFGDKLPPDVSKFAPPSMPVDVKHTSEMMNRVQGSGGHITIPRQSAPDRHRGDATPAGVDQMIPVRTVPQTPKETNSMAAIKDAAAALFEPDHKHPYQTIKENSDHSYRIGRYGLNQGFTLLGLAELMGVDLGDPPDIAKLKAYLQQHPQALEKSIQAYAARTQQDADNAHLPPNDPLRESIKNLQHFAKSLDNPQFQNEFVKFLNDMNGSGQPISHERLSRFMPKELQEAIAERGITHESTRLGENPQKLSDRGAGAIALAMLLGRTPTASDTESSQYADYTRAGSNMYKLAESRMQSLGDITVSDAQGKIIAAAANSIGRAMWQKYLGGGRLGCAASVSAVLNDAGFSYANAVGVSALQDQLVAHGWTVSNTPRPGDVVCGYRKPKGSGPGGSAHTGIVGPDGTWDNHSSTKVWSHDPLSAWNRHAYPAGVVFLHPPGAC